MGDVVNQADGNHQDQALSISMCIIQAITNSFDGEARISFCALKRKTQKNRPKCPFESCRDPNSTQFMVISLMKEPQ